MSKFRQIREFALIYLVVIMVFIGVFALFNSDNLSITGFAVANLTNETITETTINNQSINQESNETIINQSTEEKDKTKGQPSDKGKPVEKAEPNTPPVWKADVDSLIVNGKTIINLDTYFSDKNNDTITYSAVSPDNILAEINNNLITLTPAGNNFNSSVTITASDGDKETSKEVKVIVPERKIIIDLAYKSGTEYDVEDDGVETTSGIIDLTVEKTSFNWLVNEENLCTRWETYSIEDEVSTFVCYGSSLCCQFVDLSPTKAIWDEPFYSAFGQYGASSNNIVSAQVLHVNYDISIDDSFAEIYNSGWSDISASYFSAFSDFEDICVESCILDGFNDTSYTLIFEIEDAVIELDSLTYTIVETIDKVQVALTVVDSDGEVSGSYSLYKDDVLIIGEVIEPDYYDITIISDIIEKLVIYDTNIISPLTASIGIDDVSREILIDNVNVTKRYAIDASGLSFNNALLTAVATGNSLFKCKQWDYSTEVCFGTWEKIKDLVVGEQYSLTITQDDPGFIEGNSEIVLVAPLNISELTLIKNISDVIINKNNNISIKLYEHFLNLDNDTIFTYFEIDNINILFDGNIATVVPDKDFVGKRFTFITANKTGIVVSSNVFNIDVMNVSVNVTPIVMNVTVNITNETKDCSEFIRTDDGQFYCADDEKFYSCQGFEDVGDLARCTKAKFLRGTVDKSMCPFKHKDCNVTVDMDKGWGAKQTDEKRDYKLSTFHKNYQCFEGRCEIPFYFKSNSSLEGNLTFDAAAHLELRNISVERVLIGGVKEKDGKKVKMKKDDSYYYHLNFDYTPEWTSPTGIRRIKPMKFNITAFLDGEKILELDPIAESGTTGSSGFTDCDNTGDYPKISFSCTEGDVVIVGFAREDEPGVSGITWDGNSEEFSQLGQVTDSSTVNVEFWNTTCSMDISAANIVVAVTGATGDDCMAVAVGYTGVAYIRDTSETVGITTADPISGTIGDGPGDDVAITSGEWAIDVFGSDVSGSVNTGTGDQSDADVVNDQGKAVAGISHCTYADGGNDGDCVMAWDAGNNEGLIFGVLVPLSDAIKPRINASILNVSVYRKGEVVNFTANVSDEVALDTCKFLMNGTSDGHVVILNKTVTGTNDQCSQNWTIDLIRGNVINFTAIVNDTSTNVAGGNINESVDPTDSSIIGQIITIVDYVADVSIGINNSVPLANEIVPPTAVMAPLTSLLTSVVF